MSLKITGIQALPGWTKDASSGIGPTPPAIYEMISQPPSVPPPNALVLRTTGIAGKWCDWMAKAPTQVWAVNPATEAIYTLLKLTHTFKIPVGQSKAIQAIEMGLRPTSDTGYTGNGQIQADYSKNPTTMEFDVVPSAQGGWASSGLVLPKYPEDTVHKTSFYYAYEPEKFWPFGIEVNDYYYSIPPNIINPQMIQLGWQKSSIVIGDQPDANPTGGSFDIELLDVTLEFE